MHIIPYGQIQINFACALLNTNIIVKHCTMNMFFRRENFRAKVQQLLLERAP